MEFLFTQRGAGKRAIKPSKDIAFLEDQIAAESSDDSEYKVEGASDDDSNGDTDGSSSSSNENSDHDISDEGETPKDDVEALSKDDHENLTTKDLLALARKELDHNDIPKWVGKVKICGCCLGQTSTDANEIVECDGCGISVHEGCYGIREIAGSVASTVSSASTEPWFCEPCRAGLLDEPVVCELCPFIGGVYKQTDVGRWVHLVCALYVPGVAFGDPENMSKVTIFEMNYISWGRKMCSLCSQDVSGARMARTGVCISCDAGMCKSFFHVSCGQAAGLLSEPTYVTSSLNNSVDVRDQYLAHCKVHSDPNVIKRRRRSYLLHLVQSRLRRQDINSRRSLVNNLDEASETADERILRKLSRSQVHYKTERARGHEPWIPTQKLPRMLSTSASAIRKFQKVQKIHHQLEIDEQVHQEIQVMSIVEAKKKWGVPPAFNVEFIAYYQDREKRIKSLQKQISHDRTDFEALRNEDFDTTRKYDKVNKQFENVSSINASIRNKIQLFRSLLGQGGLDIPKPISQIVPARIANASSMNIKARSTAYSAQISSQSDSSRHLKSCGICTKSHDQHLLAHCDSCQLHYHLGCLTPPLTRMPKKSKLYGWSCSECYPDSSEDELKNPPLNFDEDLTNDGLNRRKRQRRQAASKALMVSSSANNSDEENQIMKKVMKESVQMAVNKASSSARPLNNSSCAKTETTTSKVITTTTNGLDNQRDDLIAMAEAKAAKAERKRKKKEEKARRKAEKKAERKRILEEAAQNGDDDDDDDNDDDSDIQVVEEDKNGVCTVRIEPKPIKLTIKTNGHHHHQHKGGGGLKTTNTTPSPAAKAKDLRTKCDQCDQPGDNDNLVRCDSCRKCFHFLCLIPPLKKSPKVPGYGWHCDECSADSDWNLD